jgi:hypothetical protein
VKTAELTGALLDCWVARALNPEEKIFHNCDGWTLRWHIKPKPFSTDWAHGGPIIEREQIHLSPPTDRVHRNGGPNAGWGESGVWMATTWRKGASGRRPCAWDEKSPLVAAMRCYVISKFGDEVPDDARAAQAASHDTGGK